MATCKTAKSGFVAAAIDEVGVVPSQMGIPLPPERFPTQGFRAAPRLLILQTSALPATTEAYTMAEYFEYNPLIEAMRTANTRGRIGPSMDQNFQWTEPETRPSALDAFLMLGAPGAGSAIRGVMNAMRAAPRTTSAGAGLLGLTAGAADAGDDLSVLPPAESLEPFFRKQQELLNELRAQQEIRDANTPDGRTPRESVDKNYFGAQRSIKRIEDELSLLDRRIADVRDRNTPEARQKQISAVLAERNRSDIEEKRRRANTPTKELYADIMPYVAPAAAGASLLIGAAMKRPYVAAKNANMTDISNRWAGTVGRKVMPDGSIAATRQQPDPRLAQEYMTEFSSASGQSGGTMPAVLAGVGIGETSQFLPTAIDYAKSLPGSDLRAETVADISDPYGVASRIFQGALLGGIPAKVGAAATGALGRKYVPAFNAETRALNSASSTRRPGMLSLPIAAGGAAAPGSFSENNPLIAAILKESSLDAPYPIQTY